MAKMEKVPNSVKPTGNKSLFPSTSESRPVKNQCIWFWRWQRTGVAVCLRECVWGARLLEALFDSCSEALVINLRNMKFIWSKTCLVRAEIAGIRICKGEVNNSMPVFPPLSQLWEWTCSWIGWSSVEQLRGSCSWTLTSSREPSSWFWVKGTANIAITTLFTCGWAL